MNLDDALIAMLSDGAGHSGEALATRLGVTRAAVWKRIDRLRAQGMQVKGEAGRGYRLLPQWRALDAAAIRDAMSASSAALLGGLEVVTTTGSTSDDLRTAASGAPDLCVRAAEHQTQGRGRRGRAWISPRGAGLWFSVLWRAPGGLERLAGLSLVVAVVLAEALEKLGVDAVGIKWPNDLWHCGRKFGGILIDLGGEAHGPAVAVIGVGIDVSLDAESGRDIDAPWTDLTSALGRMPDRNHVFAALLDALLPALVQFGNEGFENFRARFSGRDVLLGRQIESPGMTAMTGFGAGIDETGRLLVHAGDQELALVAGEVSLRVLSGAGLAAAGGPGSAGRRKHD